MDDVPKSDANAGGERYSAAQNDATYLVSQNENDDINNNYEEYCSSSGKETLTDDDDAEESKTLQEIYAEQFPDANNNLVKIQEIHSEDDVRNTDQSRDVDVESTSTESDDGDLDEDDELTLEEIELEKKLLENLIELQSSCSEHDASKSNASTPIQTTFESSGLECDPNSTASPPFTNVPTTTSISGTTPDTALETDGFISESKARILTETNETLRRIYHLYSNHNLNSSPRVKTTSRSQCGSNDKESSKAKQKTVRHIDTLAPIPNFQPMSMFKNYPPSKEEFFKVWKNVRSCPQAYGCEPREQDSFLADLKHLHTRRSRRGKLSTWAAYREQEKLWKEQKHLKDNPLVIRQEPYFTFFSSKFRYRPEDQLKFKTKAYERYVRRIQKIYGYPCSPEHFDNYEDFDINDDDILNNNAVIQPPNIVKYSETKKKLMETFPAPKHIPKKIRAYERKRPETFNVDDSFEIAQYSVYSKMYRDNKL